jgi:hypothetical protein
VVAEGRERKEEGKKREKWKIKRRRGREAREKLEKGKRRRRSEREEEGVLATNSEGYRRHTNLVVRRQKVCLFSIKKWQVFLKRPKTLLFYFLILPILKKSLNHRSIGCNFSGNSFFPFLNV